MFILRNQATGKDLKLKDSVAREVFGLDQQKHAYLLCLPATHIVQTKAGRNIQVAHERKRRKKICGTCVVRMGGLGDLIMLSSSLVKLKIKNPEKPLTLATVDKYVPVMEGLKGVDHCISIDNMDKYSFDRIIDLRYAVEPSNIGPGSLPWRKYVCNDRSDNFAELCGVNSNRHYHNIPVDSETKELFPLRKYKRPFIGFCPTTASIFRVVPHDYVIPVIRLIEKEVGGTIVLMGKTEEWNRHLKGIYYRDNVYNTLDSLNEKELIGACASMDVIISPDTGVLHIAGALKKKAIGLFGNINPATRVSYYKTVKAIYPKGKLPCIPCHDVPGACDCDKPGAPCMRLITPRKIVNAVKEILQ